MESFRTLFDMRQQDAARKVDRERSRRTVCFVDTPRAHQGPHAQRLALLCEVPLREPPRVFRDQSQGSRKVPARIRAVRPL
jgi:hypothetical protein